MTARFQTLDVGVSFRKRLAKSFYEFWLGYAGRRSGKPNSSEVILHDPAEQRPHDLDDPFFDPKVQTRMANVIAKIAAIKG